MKSDVVLKTRIERELRSTTGIDAGDIAVTVNKGIVTLTGSVRGYRLRHEAERAAKRAHGVCAIANDLEGRLRVTQPDPHADMVYRAIEMIRQLVRMGHKLYATEGTAALIERNGMPVQMVARRIGRGHPDMLDVILERQIDCVINTPGPADKEILDGIEIRRAAVERGVPCLTSIDTARTIVEAMANSDAVYTVQPFPEYRNTGTGY